MSDLIDYPQSGGEFQRAARSRPHRPRSVAPGEVVGVVGESGSGKSVTMMALMGLIDAPGIVTADEITFDGKNLLKASATRAPQDHRQGHRDGVPGRAHRA